MEAIDTAVGITTYWARVLKIFDRQENNSTTTSHVRITIILRDNNPEINIIKKTKLA